MERQPEHIETEKIKPQERFKLMDNPWDVLDDLNGEINKVGDGGRVWIKGLDFQAGEFANSILPHLNDAANRNADVRILHNPLSLFRTQGVPSYVRHIPFYPNRDEIENSYSKTKALHEKIKAETNIKLLLTRPDTKLRQFFPYAGADHQKIWIVGKTAYIGDFNPEDDTVFKMHGFMVKITDPKLVETLTDICINPPKEDEIIPGTADTYFVYDSGKSGRSRIYDFTNYLIDGTEKDDEIFTSLPLLPGHKLLKRLDAAIKRGVQVRAVASKQDVYKFSPPVYVSNRLAAKGIIRSGSDLRFRFGPEGGLHGKSWQFKIKGQSVVWSGSHNEVMSGIRAGTAELNMYSVDSDLASQHEAYTERLWESCLSNQPIFSKPK